MGLRLGLVTHPVERIDVLAEGHLQVLHEGEHPLLGRLGEVAVDIHLADSLAENSVGDGHGPLPAGLVLLDACHLAGVEIELGCVEVVAQGSASAADEVREQVVLEHLEVGGGHIVAESLEEGRLADDYLLLRGQSAGLEEGREVEAGIGLDYLPGGHGIVELGEVALLLPGPGILGKIILDGHRVVGHRLGILYARKGEDLVKEDAVTLLDGGVLALDIVVAVAYSEAALADVEDLAVTVHEVGFDKDSEEPAFSVEMEFRKGLRKGLLVCNGLDFSYVLLQRSSAFGIEAGRVEALLVEVDYLLLYAAFLRLHVRHRSEEVVKAGDIVLAELVEGSETAVLCAEGIGFLPTVRRIFVEVIARSNRRVEVGEVDGGDFLPGFVLAGCCQHHHWKHTQNQLFHITFSFACFSL